MNINEERLNDVLVCMLEGQIKMDNSPELRKAFDNLVKREEKKIILDFSQVSYIDSSGLATLIEMFQRLKKIGGRLRFSNMNQKVMSVFEITRLNEFFEIFQTREMALKDF